MVAIVRKVSGSFAKALSASPPDQPIDITIAREQHAEYRGALERGGRHVRVVAADDSCPDCCFIEDTAVIAGSVALVTRPGAPSRQAECEPVAKMLAPMVEVVRMEAPATLDGGDCMRVGKTIFVGRTARTNAAGIARLKEVFGDHTIVPVALPDHVLHLKCICAPLGDDRITLVEGTPRDAFAGLDVVEIPRAEAYAANVLALGKTVLVARGYPRTAERLAADFEVITLDTSEFRKADGSLTCLSLLL
jgi:dimethylargininase